MNKILMTVYIPMIEQKFDIFVPINKTLYRVALAIQKSILELSMENYLITDKTIISNKDTGTIYNINAFINETDLRNGSKIILL